MRKLVASSFFIVLIMSNASAQTPSHQAMNHEQHMAAMADGQRQADVAQRGKNVMPFNLKATTHIFTKTATGGTQRVVAKSATDTAQARLVRQHLQEIRNQFLKGDFSGPTQIHGKEMPGLTELRAARPNQIAITYTEVKGGAELSYKTSDARLVTALHKWFDAQVSDHGADAIRGHDHGQHGNMIRP